MPRLKPNELMNLELVEPGIIQHLPARCTLAQQISHQRRKEEIYDSGFADFYREDFLRDDHRNSVMPSKAIWPWPVPKSMDFDDFFTKEDYQSAFPLSSIRPEQKLARIEEPLDLSAMADEAEAEESLSRMFDEDYFERQRLDRLAEEFRISDEAEAYGERLRDMGI